MKKKGKTLYFISNLERKMINISFLRGKASLLFNFKDAGNLSQILLF
jgi:hypothetical protein